MNSYLHILCKIREVCKSYEYVHNILMKRYSYVSNYIVHYLFLNLFIEDESVLLIRIASWLACYRH